MRISLLPVVAMALAVTLAAAACGGSASANGGSGSAAVSSHAGTTTATGSAAGHTFQTQITSLGGLLDRVSRFTGSTGGSQLATMIGSVRRGLGTARGKLAATPFPSVVQSQKQTLQRALARWDSDLARAQGSARNGNTAQALQEARSSTYRDVKAIVDAVTAAASL